MVKKTWKRFLLSAIAAVCVLGAGAEPLESHADTGEEKYYGTSSDNGDGTFDNDAMMDSDTPDPRIICHEGAFYMLSTSMHFSPGIPVMKSYDLVNWEVVNYVYNIMDDYDNLAMRDGKYDYGAGSWAPSLTYNPRDEHFYVSHTSNTSGKTYFYKTDDIENGVWEQIVCDTFFHDASLFFDDDGTPYMFYGSGSILVAELKQDFSGMEGSPKTIITAAMTTEVAGSANTFLEATHAYKVNDTYYVFMCGWPSGMTKVQYVFKSQTIDAGYEGKLLINDDMGRGEGAAQGGILPMPDGSYMGFFMHRRGAAGRGVVLTQCVFDEEGWPVVTENDSKKIKRIMKIPVEGTFEKKSIVNSYDFNNGETRPSYTCQDQYNDPAGKEPGRYTYNGSNLKLGFEWNHNPDNRYWSLTERPGYLRLTNGSLAANGVVTGARNVLTTRTFGPESTGSIAMDISEMKDGDVAGLAAFNRLYAYCGVKMEDGQKSVIYRTKVNDENPGAFDNNDEWAETVIAPVPEDVTRVYVKLYNDYKVYGNERAYFSYSLDGESWVNTNMSRKVDFGYPQHFVGYRFGIFNFATQETGGYVDFDYFLLGDYGPQQPRDDQEAAMRAAEKLDAIQTLTPDSAEAIAQARRAYSELTLVQKEFFAAGGSLKRLEDYEAAYEALQKICAVKEPVTAGSRTAIEAARRAYDSLSADRRKLIAAYYPLLVKAEKEYSDIMAETPKFKDLSKAAVSEITAQNYTGKPLTPAFTVTLDGKVLAKDRDYTVAYKDNVKIGTAAVTITGKLDYRGSLTKTFAITLKKGQVCKAGSYTYKITNADLTGKGTVELKGTVSKKLKRIKVSDTVTIGGRKFRVTAVGASAFKGCKNAVRAVIGKNVKTIGKNAFAKASKLKTIQIKSTALKKAGKNAFKGIHAKARIRVPKKCYKKYQKVLRNKGQKKTVKLVK